MSKLWAGAAVAMPSNAFALAAEDIGCDVAAIEAIYQVESAGRAYRADGSVERRFEPHKMPGARMDWRESLALDRAEREAMFFAAYATAPNAALRASSWGAPQIMGFNAEDAGFNGAADMVAQMAGSEGAHLRAFVVLVQSWGLDAAIRAHDWVTFARRYNGSGQPEVYARRIEAAYRRLSGSASPVVLRIGDRGASVKRLQRALGVPVDGAFGPDTLEAVKEFQHMHRLPVDGVVGRRTWAALTEDAPVAPMRQPTRADDVLGKTWRGLGGVAGVGAVIGVAEQARSVLPPLAFDVLGYGVVGLALGAAAVFAIRFLRRAGGRS